MKYYAVTEDPRELYHYGVKGMKWGQHLFGDDLRPKSAAYKRAASKLRANLSNKIKTFKASAKANAEQRAIKRRANEQNNYMKAVQKTQNRMALLNNLSTLDNERKQYKQVVSADKHANKTDKYAAKFARIEAKANDAKLSQDYKQAKKALKSEKHMNKVMQEAREGRLHYGKLSEEQISRVQNRLNMEEQARKLGGKEKPSWRQQKKEARREGTLRGITAGRAAAMTEVAKAAAQFGVQHALDRWMKRSAAKQEGKEQRVKDRARNKKTARDIKRDVKQELQEMSIRSGEGAFSRLDNRLMTSSEKARRLKELERENKIEDRYNVYLAEKGLTNKQAMQAYKEGLSEGDRKKFNKLTDNQQMARLLSSEDDRKERESKDRQFRDQFYNKYVMGGKNATPSDMLERYQDDSAYEAIYGKKRISTPIKPKKPDTKKPSIQQRKPATIIGVNDIFDNAFTTEELRAIERGRRKQAKKAERDAKYNAKQQRLMEQRMRLS